MSVYPAISSVHPKTYQLLRPYDSIQAFHELTIVHKYLISFNQILKLLCINRADSIFQIFSISDETILLKSALKAIVWDPLPIKKRLPSDVSISIHSDFPLGRSSWAGKKLASWVGLLTEQLNLPNRKPWWNVLRNVLRKTGRQFLCCSRERGMGMGKVYHWQYDFLEYDLVVWSVRRALVSKFMVIVREASDQFLTSGENGQWTRNHP